MMGAFEMKCLLKQFFFCYMGSELVQGIKKCFKGIHKPAPTLYVFHQNLNEVISIMPHFRGAKGITETYDGRTKTRFFSFIFF